MENQRDEGKGPSTTTAPVASSQDVLNFWFNEIDRSLWFKKDESFDQQIRDRFTATLDHVAKNGAEWRTSPEGRLAEIIVLDQFPRNMFRNGPKAFAYDPQALEAAKEAVRVGDDEKLQKIEQKAFLYMPYMHSEDLSDHDEALKLFAIEGLELNYKFEVAHRDIIQRFGRYPHRNEILGRTSTDEEVEFLTQPGSSF